MQYFSASASYEQITSHSRENTCRKKGISSPDQDLGQLEARSRLGGEIFNWYELVFIAGEN